MTAQSLGLILRAIEQRAKIGVEAVVADNQLVELSAGGNVLIVEVVNIAGEL